MNKMDLLAIDLTKDELFIAGIGDCNGLDSYVTSDSVLTSEIFGAYFTTCSLRANTNAQRYAVPFIAIVNKSTIAKIRDLMSSDNYTGALTVLKRESTKLYMPYDDKYTRRWNKIPNPELDPYFEGVVK